MSEHNSDQLSYKDQLNQRIDDPCTMYDFIHLNNVFKSKHYVSNLRTVIEKLIVEFYNSKVKTREMLNVLLAKIIEEIDMIAYCCRSTINHIINIKPLYELNVSKVHEYLRIKTAYEKKTEAPVVSISKSEASRKANKILDYLIKTKDVKPNIDELPKVLDISYTIDVAMKFSEYLVKKEIVFNFPNNIAGIAKYEYYNNLDRLLNYVIDNTRYYIEDLDLHNYEELNENIAKLCANIITITGTLTQFLKNTQYNSKKIRDTLLETKAYCMKTNSTFVESSSVDINTDVNSDVYVKYKLRVEKILN